MISALFRRKLGARLLGDVASELRLTSLELACFTRPIGDALARRLNKRHAKSVYRCMKALTDMVRFLMKVDGRYLENLQLINELNKDTLIKGESFKS